MQRLLLKLHRWLALIFAIPLAVVILTGLVLSFEPSLHLWHRTPKALTSADVTAILAKFDPAGAARAISYRNYDGTLAIYGANPGKPQIVDVASRQLREHEGTLAQILRIARRLHVALLVDLHWLVIASTASMIGLALLGVLMGWPRLANSLSGWHKGLTWIGLPLILLPAVTGLLMVAGVTLGGGGSAPRTLGASPSPMRLGDVVASAGRSRDLSGMVWIRTMGPRHMMRYTEEGRFQGYFVVPQSIVPVPRNWPRSIHEGLWSVPLGLFVNVMSSVVTGASLVTGVLLWWRRRSRTPNRRARE